MFVIHEGKLAVYGLDGNMVYVADALKQDIESKRLPLLEIPAMLDGIEQDIAAYEAGLNGQIDEMLGFKLDEACAKLASVIALADVKSEIVSARLKGLIG